MPTRTTSAEVASDFKARDASSYDPFIEQFDAFTSRFCAPFADRLLALSGVAASERILDVGTGTGVVALRAVPLVGPRGLVVGIDLSGGMLHQARAKAGRAQVRQLDFQKMDAEALAFADRSFNAVLSLFALTHFPNPSNALAEMQRVLQPGGRLAIGIGGGPLLLSRDAAGCAVRRVQGSVREWSGRQLTAPQFLDGLTRAMLPDPIASEETAWAGRKLGRAARALEMVKQTGFVDLSLSWLEQHAVFETADEFWEAQVTISSVARKRILGASAAQVEQVRRVFDDTCREVLSRGGRLVYPLAAFYVSARKSGR